MKRFTETQKWQDVWYMDLPAKYKLAWLWVLDNCDHAGIVEANPRLMSFVIGEPIDADEFLRVMSGRVTKPKLGKWFVPAFIEFQYGDTLNPDNSAHKGVLRKLAEAGIDCPVAVSASAKQLDGKDQTRTCEGPQDKDKDKDTDQDSESEDQTLKKSEMQLRVEKLMRRRLSTPLSKNEARAYKLAIPAIKAMTEDDWQILERFYAAPQQQTFARKDLCSLLNNWNGEIDKAKEWAKGKGIRPAGTPVAAIPVIPEPPGWQAIINREFPQSKYASGNAEGDIPWERHTSGDRTMIAGVVKPFLNKP